MTAIPPGAVQAAAEAIERKLLTEPPAECMTWLEADEELARAALEAAEAVWPHGEKLAQVRALAHRLIGDARNQDHPDGSVRTQRTDARADVGCWILNILGEPYAAPDHYLGGATEAEGNRDEKWEDATS